MIVFSGATRRGVGSSNPPPRKIYLTQPYFIFPIEHLPNLNFFRMYNSLFPPFQKIDPGCATTINVFFSNENIKYYYYLRF